MRTLFIIGSCTARRTVAELAAKMASLDYEVSFLFIKDGCQCLTDRGFINSIDFAEGRYALKECIDEKFFRSIQSVDVIDYDGWVRLLEECENIVSWT